MQRKLVFLLTLTQLMTAHFEMNMTIMANRDMQIDVASGDDFVSSVERVLTADVPMIFSFNSVDPMGGIYRLDFATEGKNYTGFIKNITYGSHPHGLHQEVAKAEISIYFSYTCIPPFCGDNCLETCDEETKDEEHMKNTAYLLMFLIVLYISLHLIFKSSKSSSDEHGEDVDSALIIPDVSENAQNNEV